jgi:hypothetical protein
VGKPEDPDRYVAIQVGEWSRRYGIIYVPGEIWERLRPSTQEFDLPVGRLQVKRG